MGQLGSRLAPITTPARLGFYHCFNNVALFFGGTPSTPICMQKAATQRAGLWGVNYAVTGAHRVPRVEC